jgi:alkylated DNA repair dioxygenase AlkB
MKLFPDFEQPTNILPFDGEAIYFGPILNVEKADYYLSRFLNTIEWANDEGVIAGKEYKSKRKIAWYDMHERPKHSPRTTLDSHSWNNDIEELRLQVEDYAQTQFTGCFFNLYENGECGVGWHFDKEARLNKRCQIASLTLGAERRFDFRHIKTKKTVSLVLEHGSLLIMRGSTQIYWKHQLPKSKRIATPRINLTFRQAV